MLQSEWIELHRPAAIPIRPKQPLQLPTISPLKSPPTPELVAHNTVGWTQKPPIRRVPFYLIFQHISYTKPPPRCVLSPKTNTVSPFHLYAKHDDATQPVLIPLCVFLLNPQIWPANTMSPFPEQL